MTNWIFPPTIRLICLSWLLIFQFIVTLSTMMASSQVEIAASCPPFGYAAVHNRRHRDRSCFQNNNLNSLVSSTCIPDDNHNNDKNYRHADFTDLWVHRPQYQTIIPTAPADDSKSSEQSSNNNDHSSLDTTGEVKIHEGAHRHMKDRWARARQMVFPVDQGRFKDHVGSVSTRRFDRSNSGGGGVSSLVQKWRGFEAEAKCSIGKSSNPGCTLQEGNNNNNNNAGSEPPAPVSSEDDTSVDWESNRTASSSGPPSSLGRDSDAAESERLRVADIIRKLTEYHLNDVGSSSPPGVRTCSSQDLSEPRCFSPVLSSPRIRGRQAYNDLLMQMERDRHNELEGLAGRKAVSKFSQRGRIQALLRIRFLHRAMEAKEARHLNSSTSSGSHKSASVHFRERVNPSIPSGLVHSGTSGKGLINNPPAALPDLCIVNQQGKENQRQEIAHSKSCIGTGAHHSLDAASVTFKEHEANHISHTINQDVEQNRHEFCSSEPLHHDVSPPSKFRRQEIGWERSNHSKVESAEKDETNHDNEINSAETTNSLIFIEPSIHTKDEEATNQQATGADYDFTDNCAHLQEHHRGEATNNQPLVGAVTYSESDVSHPEVEDEWEDLPYDYQQHSGSSADWIEEISRPRSDWEVLRQARYQEMLDPFLDKEEIRVLLGRKTVSNFLSSGLREQIDKVMISRAQGQQTLKTNQVQEEEQDRVPEQEELRSEGEGDDGEDVRDEERADNGYYYDEYEEAESSIGQQSDDSMEQDTPSPPSSWPQSQGNEVRHSSYQVASPSMQQSPSISYSQDNGSNSSSTSHPANELAHDLRGHIEQLRQEMFEMRKSIKCCIDMQIKLQNFIISGGATALKNSDEKNGRYSSRKRVTSGGRCCIRCKAQVDCVLYRCGHMCACFECAHELQWGTGKCPKCEAPIMDIVRICPANS